MTYLVCEKNLERMEPELAVIREVNTVRRERVIFLEYYGNVRATVSAPVVSARK